MNRIGKVCNGPLSGLTISGVAGSYTIGGMGHDPRPGPQVQPCPLGVITWNSLRLAWDWTTRKPNAVEELL
jgi:hypothetical protein